jgi:hypothetical protein
MSRSREKIQAEGEFALDEALLPEDSWYEPGEDDEYEVEEVIDVKYQQRTRNGRRQKEYLVRWVGNDDPTWVPADDLNCTALLYEFDAKRAWESRRDAAQTAEEEDDEDLSAEEEDEQGV